jgi:hypothetical protein
MKLRLIIAFLLLLLLPHLAPAAPSGVFLHPCPGGGYLPDAVTASDGRVHLVFHRGDPAKSDLFHATFTAENGEFSDPVRINSLPGSAVAAGSVRGAQLALGKDDAIHIAWMGSMQSAPEHDHARIPMWFSRSLDGGRTFEPQRNLITTAYGLDGGGTLAADRSGNVHVLWHATGDEEGPGHRRVVLANSQDNGASFAPEQTLATGSSGVCPCCGIRAATPPEGDELLVLFRDAALPGERGIALLSIDPARHTTALLYRDPWQTETCPMSTGSFALTGTQVAVAWETEGRVKVGVRERNAGTFANARTVPASTTKSNQKHPAVFLAADGSLFVAWLEVKGWAQPGTLRWQPFEAAGQPSGPGGSQNLRSPWTRPALAATPNGILVFY